MKRDMELIKDILEYVEVHGSRDRGRPLAIPEIQGYSEGQINEHIEICESEGLLEVQRTSSVSYPKFLTWAGHDVLEKLRQVEAFDIEYFYQLVNAMEGRLLALETVLGLMLRKSGLDIDLDILSEDHDGFLHSATPSDDPDGRMNKVRYQVIQGWNEAFANLEKIKG